MDYRDAAARAHERTPGSMPPVVTVELSEASVERIAQRVASLIAPAPRNAELVDAITVARHIGMSAAWVREHGLELGGQRIGGGAKPRWRYDLQTAIQSHKRRPRPTPP